MSKSLLKRVKVCLEKDKPLRLRDFLQVIHLVGAIDKDVARPVTNILCIAYKVETKNYLIELEEELDYGYNVNTWEQAVSNIDLRIINSSNLEETVKMDFAAYDLVDGKVELTPAVGEVVEMYLERADEWEALTEYMSELESIQRKIYRDQFDRRSHYQSLWG